jgi:NitT/TauT family transport system ATP-binding protein
MKIDLRHVSFSYPGRSPLFDDFSWQVEAGESWSIIGASGSGKSTLLLLAAGLKRPSAGSITIDGTPVDRPRPRTGLVLQDHGLLPWATVEKNAALGLDIWRFYGPGNRHAPEGLVPDPEAARERVDYWMDRLGIAELRHKFPGQLSTGQRQRAAIARTLVMRPDLLLLDEPFSALDAPTREDLQTVMDGLMAEHDLTRVIVTHDIEEALRMGNRILVLRGPSNRGSRVVDAFPGGPGGEPRGSAGHRAQCAVLRAMLGDSG